MKNINIILAMALVISPTIIHSRTLQRLPYGVHLPVGVAQNYEDAKIHSGEGLDEEYDEMIGQAKTKVGLSWKFYNDFDF